jgi:hypothetical protein
LPCFLDEDLVEEEVFLTTGFIVPPLVQQTDDSSNVNENDETKNNAVTQEVPTDYTGTATLLIELNDGLAPSSRILKIIEVSRH